MQNMDKTKIKEILKEKNYKKILKKEKIEVLPFVPFARTEAEAIYCLIHDITELPICEYCQTKPKGFRYYNQGIGYYSKGCSETCTKKINNLEKYGVENVSQLDVVKKKKEETTMKNYGVKNPKQDKAIALKIKKTMDEKYGGFGTKGILRDKIEKTNIARYGVKNVMQSEYHRKKLVHTLFDKIVDRLSKYVKPNFTFEDYEGSDAKQEWECLTCGTIFEGSIDNGKIPRCPQCYPNQKMSYGEMELFNKINVSSKVQSDRIILDGKEIDIFIPDKNLAIEFNGIYWHSELNGKDKNYHLNKTKACNKKGIQLIHIFETEWYQKPDIVLSLIHAKLGEFTNRIYARKCTISEIDTQTKNIFLEHNHLQGQDKSSIKLGLFYNDELVSVMTFGKSRYNKKYEYEMHRFCNKLDYQIIGGASKLFKYFITHYNPKSIITYADRRYSNGTFYEKIGFTNIGVTAPNFFVINKSKLESRLNWQKHKLKDKLENFDNALTAWENMQVNGYDRIWDCGNYKFEWINDLCE